MKTLFIIKTGNTFPDMEQKFGGFEEWIIKTLEIDSLNIQTIDVPAGDPMPPASESAGIIITGSHAMVTDEEPWSLAIEMWLLEIVTRKIPVLGICYGHQLLAKALGGKADFHPKGIEMGTVQIFCTKAAQDDPLFKDLENPFLAHATHSQSAIQLPEKAILLAGNDFEPHHAFRVGDFAWGIQFHPEFDEKIMRMYIRKREEKLAASNRDPDAAQRSVQPTPVAQKVIQRFGRLVKKQIS